LRGGQTVGLGNGLDALVIALRAWNIGPGDEVIVPAHTFVATALAVDEVGATAVLVDVEPDTGLMDMGRVAGLITERTRAIVPVHLCGHPADMDGLRVAIGDRHIKVLEDAAQAHGARYRGGRCGGLGDAAAFSFYPTKNLGALGDGGALVTNDPASAEAARMIANYGSREKYRHEVAGRNSRLDPLQAAVLAAKLDHLDAWNARRSQLALRYFLGLADLRGLDLPGVRAWAEPVWHVFPVRAPGVRDELQAFLAERGVGTNIHYPTPVHLQPCYAGRWREGDFPVAEALAKSLLSLPLDPTHTDREIDFVVAPRPRVLRAMSRPANSPPIDLARIALDYEGFRALAQDARLSDHEKIGFPPAYREGFDDAIWADVIAKLPMVVEAEGQMVVDIGPGCATLPRRLIELCRDRHHTLVLVDSPEMLALLPDVPGVTRKCEGLFPRNAAAVAKAAGGPADALLCYSVLHYIHLDASALDFVDATTGLLAPGGRALIGDIPNLSKRRRFSSPPSAGRPSTARSRVRAHPTM